MKPMLRHGPVFAAALFAAACAGAQTYDRSSLDTSRCEIISGHTEIEGTPQPFTGRACLQPDGVWVFVGDYSSSVEPAYGYASYGYPYYPYPLFWGSPFVVGSSVVFVDHFHHFHHFHHFVRFHDSARMPIAGHSMGMHSWNGGHGWAGRTR